MRLSGIFELESVSVVTMVLAMVREGFGRVGTEIQQ